MPATSEGKAVTSRNAVTHGLHTQDVVLPHLGESRDEYDALCDGLARELSPRTAVQQHYVTQIAQAMWRLRRLRRLTHWEQHLYDAPALTDEDRINKMARVLRHDAALRRHIDRALKALTDAPANCQNEPAPCHSYSPASALADPEGGDVAMNEPEGFAPSELGVEAPSSLPPPIRASVLRKAQKRMQQQKCQNEPGIMGTAPTR